MADRRRGWDLPYVLGTVIRLVVIAAPHTPPTKHCRFPPKCPLWPGTHERGSCEGSLSVWRLAVLTPRCNPQPPTTLFTFPPSLLNGLWVYALEAEEQRRARWFHLRVQDLASGSDLHKRGEQSGRVWAPLRKETPWSNAKLFFFSLLPGRPSK